MTKETPSWQSTLIALAFILLVGAIFLVVYVRDDIDTALKAWAGLGTLVGVVVGVIPTYFFGKAATEAQAKAGEQARSDLASEKHARELAERRNRAMMAAGGTKVVAKARAADPDAFS